MLVKVRIVMKMNRQTSRRSLQRTGLIFETLECRRLLAADLMLFQNPIEPFDVNLDRHISPVDALAIINELNAPRTETATVGNLLDTSGDNILAPVDALGIINTLNNPEEDSVLTHLYEARDYLNFHHDSIPIEALDVAGQFTELIDDYEAAADAIYASLISFTDYSPENSIEVQQTYTEIEQVSYVSFDVLLRSLKTLAPDIQAASIQTFGNTTDEHSPDADVPYEFDPDDYEDPADGLPDLFNELEQGLEDVEVPEYGDVIDNYDEIYQTYEDSDQDLDVFVIDSIDVSEYEDFVLHGGSLDDLLDSLDTGAKEGVTTVEEILETDFENEVDLGTLFEDMLDSAYIGELIYNDISAIGGETTGSVIILSSQSVIEIDLGDSEQLHELAAKYDNQTVIIEGSTAMVEGVEIPSRTVIDVRSVFGATEFETLVRSLNTLDPHDNLGLMSQLDQYNLG